MHLYHIIHRIYLSLLDTAYLVDIVLTNSLKREIRMQTDSRHHHPCSHTGVLSHKQSGYTCNTDSAATWCSFCRKPVDPSSLAPLKVRLLNPTFSVHDANPLEPMGAEQHGSRGRQNLQLSCFRHWRPSATGRGRHICSLQSSSLCVYLR